MQITYLASGLQFVEGDFRGCRKRESAGPCAKVGHTAQDAHGPRVCPPTHCPSFRSSPGKPHVNKGPHHTWSQLVGANTRI